MVKKIRIYFLSKSKINEDAAKYFILNLNKLQSCFEYQFVHLDSCPIRKKYYYDSKFLFEKFNKILEKEKGRTSKKGFFLEDAEGYIAIVDSIIDNNLYFISIPSYKKAIITVNGWKKSFYPPTVFEYLAHCIIQSSFYFLASQKNIELHSHFETKGCMFDYTYYKKDKQADMTLGYLCDDCRKLISKMGKEYIDCIDKIMVNKWIGNPDEFNSVAYNLKKNYRVDIKKDTGLEKTKWGMFWHYIFEAIKPVISHVLILIIGFLVGYIIGK